MASYHRNLVKDNESEADGTLLLKGTDSEQIQLSCACQYLVVYFYCY